MGWRARWVAGGLVVLGLGHLVFGYLEPMVQADPPELNESLYEAFVTQTLACALSALPLGLATAAVVWALWQGRQGRDTVLTDNTTEDSIANNCEVVKRG